MANTVYGPPHATIATRLFASGSTAHAVFLLSVSPVPSCPAPFHPNAYNRSAGAGAGSNPVVGLNAEPFPSFRSIPLRPPAPQVPEELGSNGWDARMAPYPHRPMHRPSLDRSTKVLDLI